jgi:hypothetical protein
MVKKKEVVKDFPEKYVQIFVIVFVFLVIASIFFYYYGGKKEVVFCGDGTPSNNCSINLPYFCLNGTLIPQSSVCECPESLKSEGDLCLSEYYFDPQIVQFDYILRGREKKMDFIIYGGVSDYFANVSRSISYVLGEIPSMDDFKAKKINDEKQREWILPLVVQIQNAAKKKEDQLRIAISLVQNIPFGNSNNTVFGFEDKVDYARYPYEVLYDSEGVCSEKSELLYFILKEMGYGVVFLDYVLENHEAIGIKRPVEKSFENTGYCFIETTAPAIIGDNEIVYAGGVKLSSNPKFVFVTEGNSLEGDLYEYEDAKNMMKIRTLLGAKGKINYFNHRKLLKLKEKYGMVGFNYNI